MTSASDAQARISTRLPLGASAIHGAQASSGAARNASDARLTVPRLATRLSACGGETRLTAQSLKNTTAAAPSTRT